ncbi:hypothetical protein BXZ70DRAFT_952961 [Cristinia sonorae]|uniref:F-box domain-containing protein n=1 Tax=Cristinia sonorae TaxID=1940300 RepID=A0A8K0UIJ3_9AGAR|nr:hypothetical protein BXZ70DRAFT_952961 [Cristinia sonorae]
MSPTATTLAPATNPRSKAIQDEFNDYQRKLVQARRRLNVYTLVAWIPPEVLVEIFLHFRQLTRESEGDIPGSHEGRPYYWIKISHICYFWRCVALSTPHLWTQITVTNSACVQEMFRRARGHRLQLKVNLNPLIDDHESLPARVKLAQRCLSILPRFSSVDVLASDTQDLADLLKPATSPAHLDTLIIATLGIPGMPDSYEGSPIPFIQKSMPRLRRLQYEGPRIHWLENAFRPTLTHVEICCTQRSAAAQMFTVTRVIRALQEMPGLRHLTLREAFATTQPECRVSSPIDMAKLRFLRLDGLAKHCANFTESISVPPDCVMHFVVDGEAPFSRLTSAISAKLATAKSALKSISVVREGEHAYYTTLRGWTHIRSLTTIQDTNVQPTVTLSCSVQRLNLQTTGVEQLLAQLPLGDVRTVHFDGIIGLSKNIWAKLAIHLPAVRGARLKSITAEGFPEILVNTPQPPAKLQNNSQSRAPLYLPRLHTLLLDEVPFEMLSPQNHSFLRRLNTAIAIRKARGGTAGIIRKLMIVQGVDIVMGEVMDMKRVVPVVQWDGYELTFDDHGEIFDQFAGVGGKRGDDIVDSVQEYEG